MLAIARIYADLIISGKKKFSTVPKKLQADTKEALQEKVAAGVITDAEFKKLIKQ